MTGNLKVKQSAGIKPGTYRRVLKWCETEQNSPERGSCHSGGGRRSSVTMDDHTGKRHRKLQSQRPQLTIRKLCRLNVTYKSIKLYHLQIIRRFEDSCEGPQKSFFLNSNLQNKIYKYTSPQVIESTFYIPKQASDGSVSQHGNAEEEMEIKSKKTLHLSPWHSLSRIAPTKNTHIISKYSTKPAGNGPE